MTAPRESRRPSPTQTGTVDRTSLAEQVAGLHSACFAWSLVCCDGCAAEAEDVASTNTSRSDLRLYYTVVTLKLDERIALHLGSKEGAIQRAETSCLLRGAVFFDEEALLIGDPDHSATEDRFLLLGLSSQIRLLTVCHCAREEDGAIRVISARKATKPEKKQYISRYRQ